jgi:replication factor A1
VQVAELWDPSSESIAQVGLVGDESGTIKFVAWEASDLPELEEGASYLLENVVTEEYEGNYSIKLNSSTEISEVDEDIEVGSNEVEFSGALVDIQSRSGLIKRCPDEDCTRVLQNGRCKEHGEVDGEFDLRIKGVLDDGTGTQKVIFGEEKTEDLVGIGLDEAQQIAMDELDMQAVIDRIRPQVMGRYLTVSGPEMGRYIVVQDFERTDAQPDYSDILSNARSMSHE